MQKPAGIADPTPGDATQVFAQQMILKFQQQPIGTSRCRNLRLWTRFARACDLVKSGKGKVFMQTISSTSYRRVTSLTITHANDRRESISFAIEYAQSGREKRKKTCDWCHLDRFGSEFTLLPSDAQAKAISGFCE